MRCERSGAPTRRQMSSDAVNLNLVNPHPPLDLTALASVLEAAAG